MKHAERKGTESRRNPSGDGRWTVETLCGSVDLSGSMTLKTAPTALVVFDVAGKPRSP